MIQRLVLVMMCAMIVAFPGCAPPKHMDFLVQMMPDQEAYFRKEVVAPFAKQNHVKIEVIHYSSTDSIEQEIKKRPGAVGLVKVPFDKSRTLVDKGLFKPLDAFLSPDDIQKFKSDYLLTSLGMMDNKDCLVPRKFETRLMVYSKSKVRDAVVNWKKFRDDIDLELKKYNRFGLPSNYILEDDPNAWDFYDLFVVGWVWAHTPYDGKVCPRIAHRGQRYSGTSLGLVDKVFQLGGDSTSVLTMSGEAVTDAFFWEAVYASSGIYNPRMWTEGWAGAGIWQGIARGEVFLSFMTQLDCFYIHGTGRDNLSGYMKDPDDMGVATMPQGCSLEVDVSGIPAKNGSKSITTGGWWWGIPFDAPDAQLSYKLASYVTSTGKQIEECSRFGMIPVRKDILSDMSMMFGGGWITQIYETSFRQLMANEQTLIPSNPHFAQIGDLYLDAWYDIVVGKNWSPDKAFPSRAYIKSRLESIYAPKAQGILAGKR